MTTKNILIVLLLALFIFLGIVTTRVLWLRRSVATFRTYWEQRAVQYAGTEAFTYVALGDSAGQGIGATKPQNGYVGIVAEYLAEQTKRPIRVINLSVSGARINDLIDTQLPRLAGLKPDLITVEIGANDVLRFESERFRSDFSRLIDVLPKGTVVANIPSFRGSRLGGLAQKADEANTIATNLIRSGGYTMADLHVPTNSLAFSDYAADYFHPSDSAYRTKWAPAFIEAIEDAKVL
jgi:lysophospholipase L1-like esterase